MSELSALTAQFVQSVAANGTEIYNEFSLQHEFGIFLRAALPKYKVQFEHNVESFGLSKQNFTKRELDIAVFAGDKTDLKYAIELKYPRNGQYPEQMFSFCKDVAFAEQLKAAGFSSAGLLIFADARPFYAGSAGGIYGFFRAGRPITGRIEKPTEPKNDHVEIKGSYVVSWAPVSASTQYAFVEVKNAG
ncbi:MAG: hypothetical protein P4L70_07030 [Parasulfuritortus sp.]|nr:hypothetical protein [Parasulfuritortus sp.]